MISTGVDPTWVGLKGDDSEDKVCCVWMLPVLIVTYGYVMSLQVHRIFSRIQHTVTLDIHTPANMQIQPFVDSIEVIETLLLILVFD